jgi:hypothetical protein
MNDKIMVKAKIYACAMTFYRVNALKMSGTKERKFIVNEYGAEGSKERGRIDFNFNSAGR